MGADKGTLQSLRQRTAYFPGFLGLLVNPFYFARKGLAIHVAALGRHIAGKTLDVGCGSKPYQALFRAEEYVGLELDSPENRRNKRADFYYDGKRFPFADESFDSVVASEVLEHVFGPDEFLAEIVRVLKPRGSLLLTVPFVWAEHEQPLDFARYSSFGLKFLMEKHGLEIVEMRKSNDDVRAVFQMLTAYIYTKIRTSSTWVNLALTVILIAPFNVMGELLAIVTPANPDLYLDNIVLARKNKTSNQDL